MATPIPRNQAGFSLGEVASVCRGTVPAADSGRRVRGVTTDSRSVSQGNLFVAIRGERHDGHGFLDAAAAAGAGALLVERGVGAPRRAAVVEVDDTLRALGDLAAAFRGRWNGRVVGITGSVGKTTAKEYTAAALSATGATVLATAGNLNNLVGVPMTLFQLDPGFEIAVVEMGTSRPGEIARLAEMARPEIGVVTSVAVAHTEGLGSIEAVAREKTSLLRALPSDGTAVYDADNPSLGQWLSGIRAGRRLTFGSSALSGVRLVSQKVDALLANHCRFELPDPGLTLQIDLQVPGRGAGLNAAVALAVALALRGPEPLEKALRGIRSVRPVQGRLRPVPGPNRTLFLDDTYNSNPESAAGSIDAATQVAGAVGGRTVAILGDMAELGKCARDEHERVGRTAIRSGVEVLIACGPEMAAAAEAAICESSNVPEARRARVVHVDDPAKAIPIARDIIRERDVVLIKGSRCMEMERVLQGLAAPPEARP